jgi:predicted RNA-binding Zn-ribbon protein involved in translation (DUF1610 family)
MANVLCAKCEVVIQGPTNPEPSSIFSCPSCGIEERFDAIMQDAQAYLELHAKKDLNKSLEKIARDSKFITVTPFNTPERQFRFILDI